ncbi:MAG: sigma-70 family RNA polymerase sigma factor [Flavitalea sp.]
MSAKLQSESELLKRVAEGNEMAFKLVFDLYNKKFFGAALKMTRSSDFAEEVVQEIFVMIWINRTRLAFAQDPPAYLFSIAYNCIYAQFKKTAIEKRARKCAARNLQYEQESHEHLMEKKESREILERIIQILPQRQQIIFRLSKQEELSRNEIARQLCISPNTVRNHLQEARKFIRLKLNK